MVNMIPNKIEKVVLFLDDHTWKETAKKFKISEMTISRYIKKFNQVNIINDVNLINLLKKGFNTLLRKSLLDMSTAELKVLHFLLTRKNVSMKKKSYILKIKNLAGVKR